MIVRPRGRSKGNGHGSEPLDQEREVHLHAHCCFLSCLYEKNDSLYFLQLLKDFNLNFLSGIDPNPQTFGLDGRGREQICCRRWTALWFISVALEPTWISIGLA